MAPWDEAGIGKTSLVSPRKVKFANLQAECDNMFCLQKSEREQILKNKKKKKVKLANLQECGNMFCLQATP